MEMQKKKYHKALFLDEELQVITGYQKKERDPW